MLSVLVLGSEGNQRGDRWREPMIFCWCRMRWEFAVSVWRAMQILLLAIKAVQRSIFLIDRYVNGRIPMGTMNVGRIKERREKFEPKWLRFGSSFSFFLLFVFIAF